VYRGDTSSHVRCAISVALKPKHNCNRQEEDVDGGDDGDDIIIIIIIIIMAVKVAPIKSLLSKL
jgi:hypothetical protein